jgi:ribosomal protein S18 acetylase RimI-like enzyme
MSKDKKPVPVFRTTVTGADRERVRAITSSSRFFTAAEIDVAIELVDDRIAKGPSSEYQYLFAELDGMTVGYSCFGLIACTVSSYDLYWIAVTEEMRGRKLGTVILLETERAIKARGGTRVYVETSSRSQYESTRLFYEKRQYQREGFFEDFYAPGDGKVVYVKAL